jgi:hypothetical protein
MNRLIKLVSFILFCVFVNPIFAQESGNEYSKISFSLRGKYIVFGILEDTYWRAYSYGGEIYIGKHHAIGIDGEVFRFRSEMDDSDDQAMYSEITRRSYIYVDYKYIYPFNPEFSLYGQLYSKLLGKRMDWIRKEDYEYETPVDLSFMDETKRGTFTDIGIGIGAKFYFTDLNLGADVSVNVFKHYYSTIATNYSDVDGWSTEEFKEPLFPVYIRMNLFYHFFRFKR